MGKLAKDLTDNQTTVPALEQAVNALEETVATLTAERDDALATVLLAENAYVLNEVAVDFVFRSDKRPRSCSIDILHMLAADGELTGEQVQRWQQFKTYMKRQGWTVADLVGKADELRAQRYPLARGSIEQQEAVTPAMLEEWVNKFFGHDDDMRALIKLISKFTLPNQPLLKSPRSREIVEHELSTATVE